MSRPVLLAWILTAALQGFASPPLADKLSIEQTEKLRGMMFGGRPKEKNLEKFETTYQNLVQVQTFADLRRIYDPANQDKLEITYPAFIPEGGGPGADGGFGFHVVKRLTLDLGDGRTKTIAVNEQWPEDRIGGGILLPDEIRMKTQVADGERHVEGSEALYLYDSIRLAWNESNEPAIRRRTRYVWENGRNRVKPMRSKITGPLACQACHTAGNPFAEPFLEEGEERDHEFIVQRSYFQKKLEDTDGFRDYVAYLEGRGAKAEFIARARRDLLHPVRTLQVPGLFAALEKAVNERAWLMDDEPYRPEGFEPPLRQGIYQWADGKTYLDATELLFEGKYRWWFPFVVIPAGL